jgi:3-oxoacyl-[acyl-carrier protein] reductase
MTLMEQEKLKCAIVTGASGGIGRAVAIRLAHDGFAIIVHYSGNRASADNVVKEIEKTGGRAFAIQAEVSNPSDINKLFKKALETFGLIDVVVNTAGIMELEPIEANDLESFDRVIATNLRGTFIVFANAAKYIKEGGRIIGFSSSVIAKSFPTYGAYIASKAGVEGLVHVFANELRGRNVTVNAVAPGPVATKLFLEGKSEAEINQLKKLAPLERLGEADDIAKVVSFLAGPDGEWINGQVIRANGGFV